jgi:hypothetical protein
MIAYQVCQVPDSFSGGVIRRSMLGIWAHGIFSALGFLLQNVTNPVKTQFLDQNHASSTRVTKDQRPIIKEQKERSYWGSNPGSRYSEIDMTRCLFQKPMCSPLHYTTVDVDICVLKDNKAQTKRWESGFGHLQRTWDSQFDRCRRSTVYDSSPFWIQHY